MHCHGTPAANVCMVRLQTEYILHPKNLVELYYFQEYLIPIQNTW